ncbi:MAG: hypothetical protein JXR58_11175 [Bacteroidales bacterium]|nr:hypothetical protein [Bacteroidales bacterium]
MRRKVSVIVLAFLASILFLNAQEENYYFYGYGYYNKGIYSYEKGLDFYFRGGGYILSQTHKDYLVKNKTKSQETKVYNYKKGIKKDLCHWSYYQEFDVNGNLILNRSSKNEKVRREISLKFNEDQKPVLFSLSKKGELQVEEQLTYDSQGNETGYMQYKDEEKKLVKSWLAEYNNNKIVKRQFFKKGNENPTNLWIYEYYSDGANKQTSYFKKGKLQRVWSFECDSEGKETNLKDTFQLCEYKEYHNDGSYTEVFRTTSKKGKIQKTLKTYDKDSSLVKSLTYNSKDQIRYGFEQKIENGKTIYYANYWGGKLRYIKNNSYNEDGKLLKTVEERKKNKREYLYTYNDEGKNSMIKESKNGKLVNTKIKEHYENGKTKSILVKNKKDLPVKLYEYFYNNY